MKQIICFFIYALPLFLTPHKIWAQKEAAIWYFGSKAGLDFNFSPPKAITSPNILTQEGCSSIADNNGNLLFYTDGKSVWNKQHLLMENGNGLLGDASSTHSSVVVKKPLSSTEYYIITSDAYYTNNNGVNYSIVDLTFNNGLGKIISKNNPLVISSTEKIAVTPHHNKRHAWVVIPELNSSNLHIYLVTENGFQLKTTYSTLVPYLRFGPGQIKFSQDGKHLMLVLSENNGSKSSVHILDFNNSTGVASTSQVISGGSYFYGAEFSPDAKRLYITTYVTPSLCQCDVLPGTFNYLTACQFYPQYSFYGQLQLGPDQKIYVAKSNKNFIGTIEFPDSAFTKTNYIDSAVGLLPTTTCALGLPTFNTGYLLLPSINIRNTCAMDTARFSIDTSGLFYDSLSWLINGQPIFETGPSASFVFSQAGKFPISVIVHFGTIADTLVNLITILPLPISPAFPDTSVCFGQTITFNARREPDVQYQWNTGGTDSTLTFVQPGSYSVRLTKNGCSVIDSVQLSVNPYPVINIPDEVKICLGTSITTHTPSGNYSFLWSTGDTTSSVVLNNEGPYWVAVTENNCTSSDTFLVFINTLPVANLGPDTGICENQTLSFTVTHPYSNYLWSTGSTDSVFWVTKAGMYAVQIENICGTAYDSILISQHVCNCLVWAPNAFTPNGDLTNDLFMPSLSCDYTGFDLKIYSKWGEEIFHSTSILNAWDGKYKGSSAPSDVYVWKLSCVLTNTAGKEFISDNSGTVTLLR